MVLAPFDAECKYINVLLNLSNLSASRGAVNPWIDGSIVRNQFTGRSLARRLAVITNYTERISSLGPVEEPVYALFANTYDSLLAETDIYAVITRHIISLILAASAIH